MKRTVSVFLVTGLLVLAIAGMGGRAGEQSQVGGHLPPDMAWQLSRTADPATGKIPSGAVMQAWHTLKARGYYPTNVFRTEDEATGWQQINDFFPSLSVTRITYDPNNTQHFYFCTGEGWYNADAVKGAGVFASLDGGDTWAQLPSTANSTFDYCQDMVVHPLTSDIYVATRTGGLQRSSDGGATWEKVLGFGVGASKNSVCDIELTADGGVFAAIGIFEQDGIYFSPSGDAGTFVKQTSGLPSSGYFRIEMATAPSDANVAYSIYCNSSDYKIKGIYKTTNKGASWTEINRPENNYDFAAKQAWYDLSLAVSPSNADVVAMGGLNIWRTRDGGDTWERMSSGGLDSVLVRYVHVDQHEVTFRTDDEVYFGNDGGIWRTTDFTAEQPFIYHRNNGYNVTQFYSADINPIVANQQVMGGTQDNGTPYAYDPGVADFKMVSGGDGAFVAFNTVDADKFYTASQLNKLFRFNNGGFETPDTITNPNLNDGSVQFINPFALDASDPEVLYWTSKAGVWRLKNASTADTGQWQKAANLNGVISAIGSSPAAPGVLFIGRSSGVGDIYRLDDAYNSDLTVVPFNTDLRDSLPDAPFTGSIYCSSIVVDHHDANHVVATYSNYNLESVWECENALSPDPIWTCIEGDLPDIPVYWSAIHPQFPDIIYIATEIGVFYTMLADGANTVWIPCASFPAVRTDMLKVRTNDGIIVAATHGRGIWQATLDHHGLLIDPFWSERGPANVGGRTRTIMVDPNDPSGKTVWAGSIAGGLWKTTDIDAVPVYNQTASTFTLSVSPNPASSIIRINLSGTSSKGATLTMYRMDGSVAAVIGKSQLSGQVSWQIPSGLSSGTYLLVATDGQNRAVQRVIVL